MEDLSLAIDWILVIYIGCGDFCAWKSKSYFKSVSYSNNTRSDSINLN